MSISWQPTASLDHLRQRAIYLAQIRQFFAERAVLEVETPIMCQATVTDPHVIGIPALFQAIGSTEETRCYLHTSPEYAMKRLLAAGIGSIYQMSKVFRQGDLGRIHNPEFTMLEWYHVGFDHHQLMDEVDDLLQLILQTSPAERVTYGDIFMQYVGVNAHEADLASLAAVAAQRGISVGSDITNKDDWLNVLWAHVIEPQIGQERPLFLYDFPLSQASLAKLRQDVTPPVASRFEVYFKGVELANGFHELQDAEEQAKRFEDDLAYRAQHNLPIVAVDELFLQALESGIPDCAGVALGVDRLLMLAMGSRRLSDVLSFAYLTC